MVWDFAEVMPASEKSGGYNGAIEWIGEFVSHALKFADATPPPVVLNRSSTRSLESKYDIVLTDPPYYDAISYSDLMDFFHVWLRRVMHGKSPEIDAAFNEALGPKWNHQANDGELVDDPSRHGWDREKSKAVYEDGMFRTFQSCYHAAENRTGDWSSSSHTSSRTPGRHWSPQSSAPGSWLMEAGRFKRND